MTMIRVRVVVLVLVPLPVPGAGVAVDCGGAAGDDGSMSREDHLFMAITSIPQKVWLFASSFETLR